MGNCQTTPKKWLFWWQENPTILENYEDIAKVHLGNGLSIFFWKDKWDIEALENTFQELYPFVKNKSLLVSKVFKQDQITTLLYFIYLSQN